MVCTNCKRDVPEYSNFCSFCGARLQVTNGQARARKRLTRSSVDRKVAGVCGGIAEYFEVDATVVRLAWVILLFVPMPVLPAIVTYLVAWLIMPLAPLPATAAAPSANVPRAPQAA